MNILTKFRSLSLRNKAILIAVLIYCAVPDVLPGPVDDILVIVLGYLLKDESGQTAIDVKVK